MVFAMKTLNTSALKAWLATQGPNSKVELSYKTGIGFYTLGRILRGDKQPSKAEQMALLLATGLSRAELLVDDVRQS
jgi:hypothetical protein